MDIMDIAIAKALAGGGGGGGASSFMVTFTLDLDTMTTTADKTYSEIETAIENGSYVYGIIEIGETGVTLLKPVSYQQNSRIDFEGINETASDGTTLITVKPCIEATNIPEPLLLYAISRTSAM